GGRTTILSAVRRTSPAAPGVSAEVRPYGTWSSPITADMLVEGTLGLSELWLEDGVTYWREGRPAEGGRGVIVRGDPWSTPADLIPEGFNARTTVHEYGGGSYLVHRGGVWFSNMADQRLYRVPSAGGSPEPVTPDSGGTHRYADGRITPDGSLLITVRERHEGDGRADLVVNELAVFPPDGSAEPRTIAGGRDFYAAPRVSPDGSKLCWLEWDLPFMPWDGTELWVADLGANGTLSGHRRVEGRLPGTEGAGRSVLAPEWSPTGDLCFANDPDGWWNLYRERDGETKALTSLAAEFAWPAWGFGQRPYGFLSDGRIACLYGKGGVQHVALLDPTSGELLDLDLPHTAIDWPQLAVEGSSAALIAAGPTIPAQVLQLDFASRGVEVLRESTEVSVDAAYLSVPIPIEFPTEGGLTAHAHYYPPANPSAEAPEGELPPLIVHSHGGPTAEHTPAFELDIQYFTSRGFALVDVNYGGSTGYGREYRERLYGTWGVIDTMDCINAAKHLGDEGLADPARFIITGGSAGGYTTLCALTFHDDFAVGSSYFGLADLEPFATGETHKFESRYLDQLIGPYPEAADTFRARSPIHYVDMLSCPVLLLQGAEDEVVPPAQAEIMVEALKAKGLPYAYLSFEGEQHGFRRAENIIAATQAELSFYGQILGFEPPDVPRLAIENRA
ncbi:MAG: S9 family peptidase, partial [Actinomycetota bacterium]